MLEHLHLFNLPTTNNGFLIFDSDYYDNGGTVKNWAGPYPANSTNGNIGIITTPSIDYQDIII